MPCVTFQPQAQTAAVPPGTPLLDAARLAGVEIDSPCGGKGTCGKCMVRILRGHVDSGDLGMLPPAAVVEGYVLACMAKVRDSDLTVEVPERIGTEGGKFADFVDDVHLIRKELLPDRWNFDPLALKWYLHVPQPRLGDGLADVDRVTRAIQRDWGPQPVLFPLPVIQCLAEALRCRDGHITVTLIRGENRLTVVRVEPGDTTVRHYGIALDVGTTTIAVQLVYLPLAETVATASDYNGQIACGLDVISRINYARRPDRLAELRARVLKTVNGLIARVTTREHLDPLEICNAVVSGNTTMIHLLLGLQPEYIRLDPYTPTVHEVPYLTASAVGLAINPESWVCFSPAVGSYVGGDITAGVLCTDLAADAEAVSL
ncbi:MAG: 2Fe-2S iron-sulfur cluster binding domain-containing protein, partial [Lentisphaeria bacterium]|nr:2Fe-2S iron-sulfur cluster binding domain-containing protein [Lentisphaeria bacterium]